jgi:hypothetical protein
MKMILSYCLAVFAGAAIGYFTCCLMFAAKIRHIAENYMSEITLHYDKLHKLIDGGKK